MQLVADDSLVRARLPGRARKTALAIARALVPEGGERIPPGGERTVARAERIIAGMGPGAVGTFARLLEVCEHAARLEARGRSFSSLSTEEAARLLTRWQHGGTAVRTLAYALLGPLKIAHFDDPDIYFRLRCTYRFHGKDERAPWMQRVIASQQEDETIECDAVVVGTGAGGGVVAKELAARGHAVLMIEEGAYNGRAQFDGSAIGGIRKLWRDRGMTGTIGNTAIPIPLGRTVGGSTAINTGTCWRTPSWILDRWVGELGLAPLGDLDPYFDRVEAELRVARADAKYLGGVAKVVARGCDVLGYSHRALDRNAPDCDGSGVCDFGCPTDARRSTNVSYVPSALRSGAELRTNLRAERILFEGDRAAGIVARSVTTGKKLEVRARATILACGAMLTPLLLMRHGLHRKLRHVGRNLSIHPATSVSAVFEEEIRGYAAIPQGYCVDELHREGILCMGASVPIDLGALQFPLAGQELLRVMDRYDRVATMGVMVEDESRGRVALGPAGRPIPRYFLGRKERERLVRGVVMMSRIFLAAGATDVYTGIHGHRRLRGPGDLARLRESLPPASDFVMMAFHPLGTCRMARSDKEGVVSTDHEVFGVRDLFIADGSVVPTAPAVNPQETIMALATRAADRIAMRL